MPSQDKRTGCSVSAAAMETSGTTIPAAPSERRKGTGIRSSVARPTMTAIPDTATVCPARSMVATTASVVE